MGKSERLKLHGLLKQLSQNVYFQPPSNVKLEYPCIIYRRSDIDTVHANNKAYVATSAYILTVITRDPDSELPEQLLSRFAMCGVDTAYVTDNLHHTLLTLFY